MAENENFLVNMSILYRNVMKYFDHVLAKYEIGYGQIVFLTFINENEGCTMQDVTNMCEVDKGTTTKSINRLIEQGYVQARQDINDRRSKRLYTTKEANEVMRAIYQYRNDCRNVLAKNIDFEAFSKMLEKVTQNARRNLSENEDLSGLKIGGFIKTSLIDYPGKVSCVIFTSGCMLKCPYCHNKDLVYIPENYSYFHPQEILDFLNKRKNILDGVCVSGGEPLMQEQLIPFLKEIKKLNYEIKLDTNGMRVDKLKQVVDLQLVDYIAMDVKQTKEKYAFVSGCENSGFDVDNINACIQYIKACGVSYEFRTTVVKEFHTIEDIQEIARWIGNCESWYLQQFHDNGNCIQQGLHAYDVDEMKEICNSVKTIVENVALRGLKDVSS